MSFDPWAEYLSRRRDSDSRNDAGRSTSSPTTPTFGSALPGEAVSSNASPFRNSWATLQGESSRRGLVLNPQGISGNRLQEGFPCGASPYGQAYGPNDVAENGPTLMTPFGSAPPAMTTFGSICHQL